MSVAELKDSVLALPQNERHELIIWINQLEANCGDVPGEALDQLAAEIWDEDVSGGRHAPDWPAPKLSQSPQQPSGMCRTDWE